MVLLKLHDSFYVNSENIVQLRIDSRTGWFNDMLKQVTAYSVNAILNVSHTQPLYTLAVFESFEDAKAYLEKLIGIVDQKVIDVDKIMEIQETVNDD